MGKKWQKSIGVVVIRFLQITIILGILIYTELIVLGYAPAPDIVDMLALLLLFLLGLLVLALNWLIFKLNRIDK
jgi:hypothetical protein